MAVATVAFPAVFTTCRHYLSLLLPFFLLVPFSISNQKLSLLLPFLLLLTTAALRRPKPITKALRLCIKVKQVKQAKQTLEDLGRSSMEEGAAEIRLDQIRLDQSKLYKVKQVKQVKHTLEGLGRGSMQEGAAQIRLDSIRLGCTNLVEPDSNLIWNLYISCDPTQIISLAV